MEPALILMFSLMAFGASPSSYPKRMGRKIENSNPKHLPATGNEPCPRPPLPDDANRLRGGVSWWNKMQKDNEDGKGSIDPKHSKPQKDSSALSSPRSRSSRPLAPTMAPSAPPAVPYCSTREGSSVWLAGKNAEYGLLGVSAYTWAVWILNFFAISQTNRYMARGYVTKAHTGVSTTLWALSILFHLKTMFTDPGAIPKDAIVFPNVRSDRCHICRINVPSRYSWHCSICNRCISDMDHHCVYMNNCIGMRNQKPFLWYLIYTLIATIMFTFASAKSMTELASAKSMTERMPYKRLLLSRLGLDIVRMPFASFATASGGIVSLYLAIVLKDQLGELWHCGLHDKFGSNWWEWILPTNPKFLKETQKLRYYRRGDIRDIPHGSSDDTGHHWQG